MMSIFALKISFYNNYKLDPKYTYFDVLKQYGGYIQ